MIMKHNTVKVIFSDSQYNYETSVNKQCSIQEIVKYFVGQYINMGIFPVENIQKCIAVNLIIE